MGTKGRMAGLISGSMYRSAGNASLFFPEFAMPETNNGYAENADGDHFEHAFTELKDGDFRLEGMIADRIRHFPTGGSGAVFDDPANRDNDARGYIEAGVHRKLGAETDLDVTAYYDAYRFVGSGDYGAPGSSPLAVDVKARADWVGTDATVTRQIGAQRITGGGEYEYSLNIRQWAYAAGEPDVFWSNETPWRASVFAEAEVNVVPRVVLHAGARVDKFSNFADAVSPRAAVIYSPDERTTVKYIAGRSFRDPNAYEEYYADGVTVTPGPSPLVPERIVSNELVLERSLTRSLSVTGDGFYNQLKDLIDQVTVPGTTLSYFVNDDHVHAEGLEVEVDAKRASGWEGRASYTATMATDDVAHAALANAPHSQAKLNGNAPTGRWGTAGVELLYVSALTDMRGTRVSPYLLPNLTLSTRPLWGGWQFASSGYDATNRRWFSPAGPNDPEDQIQMDGRGWRFKVTYRTPARGGGREP